MRSRFLNKMLNKGRKGNPLDRLSDLEQKSNAGFLQDPSVEKISDITTDLGTMYSGEFISPASTATDLEPTSVLFTGAAMGGDGWTFGGVVYHFIAVAAGVLQAGFNAAGKFLAGAGSVIIDALGISLLEGTGEQNAIDWKDSGGTIIYDITADKNGAADNVTAAISANSTTNNALVTNTLSAAAGGPTGVSNYIKIVANDTSGAAYTESDKGIIANFSQADSDSDFYGTSATPVVKINAGTNSADILAATIAGNFTNSNVRSATITLNDDSATSITPIRTVGGILLIGVLDANIYGVLNYNTGTPSTAAGAAGSITEVTTGVLNGTTGVDTRYTVSAHDGKIYFENRRGAARTVVVLLF